MKQLFLKTSLHFIIVILLLASGGVGEVHGQSINNQWKQDLNSALEEFIKCKETGACSNYVGESLRRVYNINDFYSSAEKRYLRSSEISEFIRKDSKWTLLGRSFEQSALEEAQKSANAKKAVVAVYMSEDGFGHVVLIVPGALTPSGSWGLKVPNAASFPASDPQKSFVDKGLSFAFTKNMMKDVFLYVRNY
jgi:hypothetical protein